MTDAATSTRQGVCLNVHGAQSAEFWDRGIARYVVEHSRALLDIAPELVHSVRASPALGFTPSLLTLLDSGKVRRTSDEPRDAAGRGPAIYHAMSPLEWGHPIDEIWPRWAREPDVGLVVTLYDLIPELFPERYNKSVHERVAWAARLELVKRADHLLAISQHTAEDAIRELRLPDDRVTVIDAAASESFLDAWPGREDAEAFVRTRIDAIDRDFAFYVGGMDERKNLKGLVTAWSQVAPDVRARTQLVITCGLRSDQRGELERHAAQHGLSRSDLVLTGRVSDDELAALYRSCRLFVFASLYEGSGLPMLEAMTAEAPVIASNTSTGPEILGELDGTFDPADPADMARVLEQTLRDPTRLERYRERSARRVTEFSWQRVAEHSVTAYERVLERRRPARRRVRRARPRIALLAPAVRPARAADAALARVAALLGSRADVEVIRDGPAGDHHGTSRYELRRNLGHYDRTLHVLGDEPEHRHAYESLVRFPGGTVLFEDVRLGGFQRWYTERVGGPIWSSRQLERQYGALLPGEISLNRWASANDAANLGLLFTREVQALASHVIAPCRMAGLLLDVDRLGEDPGTPISVLAPPGIAPVATVPRPFGRLVVAAEPPGSPGAELLLRALTELPGTRLALLCGTDDPAQLRRHHAAVERLGVADRVEPVRRLTEAGRHGLLANATVAALPVPVIDLDRIAFAGDCLARGIPIVAASMGWAVDELPQGAAQPVAADPSAAQLAAGLRHVLDDTSHGGRLATNALEWARAQPAEPDAWFAALELS